MAKDNDKGLYLPLRIDLTQWEADLAAADADVQKEMRKMRAATSDLKLRYEVEVANAKIAGNEIRAIELENEKLNAIYEIQKQEVEALSRAYQKSVKEKGADAKATVGLANALVTETKKLERQKAALDAIANEPMRKMETALSAISPRFAMVRESIENAKKSLDSMGISASDVSKYISDLGSKSLANAAQGFTFAKNQISNAVNGLAEISPKFAAAKKAVESATNAVLPKFSALGEAISSRFSIAKNQVAEVVKSLDASYPKFKVARETIERTAKSLGSMQISAAAAAKAMSALGIAAGAIALGFAGFEKITKHVEDIAKAGVAASDPIYQLRESLQSTYEDAEFLYNVTKVDGSNAESLKNALTKLDATLKNDKEGTNSATIALKKYGAELMNADGTVKTYREQLIELSKAARTAASVGQYGDFKAALPGALRSTEFDHLLLGLDGYAEKAKAATTESKVLYDELHLVTDWTNALTLAEEHNAAVRGGFAAEYEVAALKDRVDTTKALTLVLKDNEKEYKNLYKDLGTVAKKWTEFKSAGEIALASILTDAVKLINKINDLTEGFKGLRDYIKLLPGGGIFVDYLFGKMEDAKKQITAKKEEITLERQLNELKAQGKKEDLNKIDNTAGKSNEDEIKRQEAYAEFNKKMRDLQSDDYQKQINQLNDEVEAFRNEKIAEFDIERFYNLQKQKIDEAYYAKVKTEKEKQLKQSEDMYKKEMEAAKRAREASISEAESTLKNNLKLIRYVNRQQKAGTYNEADAKAYADRLYMKQAGFKSSDVSALKSIGVDYIKEIANARDRIFGQFATASIPATNPITNNNNVTINFDNTILDNVNAMDLLAQKVAGVMFPAIENAIKGNMGNNAFGYGR